MPGEGRQVTVVNIKVKLWMTCSGGIVYNSVRGETARDTGGRSGRSRGEELRERRDRKRDDR